MTPPEYSAIRPYLGHSSGFQSWQYRCIEFSLGNKNAVAGAVRSRDGDLLAVAIGQTLIVVAVFVDNNMHRHHGIALGCAIIVGGERCRTEHHPIHGGAEPVGRAGCWIEVEVVAGCAGFVA